jgi:hypothetical protein
LAGEAAEADHGGKAVVGSWPVPVQRFQADALAAQQPANLDLLSQLGGTALLVG